jgi:hypothetical protein
MMLNLSAGCSMPGVFAGVRGGGGDCAVASVLSSIFVYGFP